MVSGNTTIHLLAGGMGGTAGAVITCPLEVVKTRLQSSVATFQPSQLPGNRLPSTFVPNHISRCASASFCTCSSLNTNMVTLPARSQSHGLLVCLRHIIQTEGASALFKGLGPTLVGVAPSRAIYFFTYAQSKSYFNGVLYPDTPIVHILSAASAGFMASTVTNPLWFIKTRLQLDQKRDKRLSVGQCVRHTYKSEGIRGFYKGVTASYYGISETVIHFVIYEAIKAKIREHKRTKGEPTNYRGVSEFLEYMCAGAISKTCATCAAYPHEVARTRLREEGSGYHTFWQTLGRIAREEGYRGLYRGLATQLVRQIPNTAVMMATYEAVVYLFTQYQWSNHTVLPSGAS